VSDQCLKIREWLEEGRDPTGPALAAHLSNCAACGAHRVLLSSLARLEAGEASPGEVKHVLLELPATSWQRRRWRSWTPALAGSGLVVVGLLAAGGVPAAQAPAGLVAGLAAAVTTQALDLATVVRGGGDAARILLAAGGLWMVGWLTVTALGGGLAMRALVRRGR
jgi:hypothetical protein